MSVVSKYTNNYKNDGSITYYFYDKDGNTIETKSSGKLSSGTINYNFDYTIPSNCYKIRIYGEGWRFDSYNIYEIKN